MNKANFLFSLFFVFLTLMSPELLAQKCGFDQLQQELMAQDEQYRQEVEAFGEQMLEFQTSAQDRSGPFTIPVVVHIIHSGESIGQGRNVSDARVLSQLNILNDDFQRLNSDANQTPSTFANLAANTTIEFCLSVVDASGNPTSGITRHQYNNVSSINYIATVVKPQTIWDPNKYLNIWVLEMPDASILGYSFLPTPTMVGSNRDGLVLDYRHFGFISNSNKGRTSTHEIGHYLGLKHMWGSNDGNGNPIGCSSDDDVTDTPNSSGPYYNCPSGSQSSCSSQDMYMNYMDYVDDNCMNLFTTGQANVMKGVLNGLRASLIAHSSIACSSECLNLTSSSMAMGFEAGQGTGGWLIENTNGDNRGWSLGTSSTTDYGAANGEGLALYLWNTDLAADDYLFTPCFTIEANEIYELEFSYACARDDNQLYTEAFEVGYSFAQSSSDFTVPGVDWRFDPVDNAFPNYQTATLRFSSDQETTLSLGFHVFSPKDKYALQLDDINLRYTGLTETKEVVALDQFRVFPNPTQDWVQVDFGFTETREAIEIVLQDLTGRVLESRQLRNVNTENIDIDLSGHPQGVYLITLKDGRTAVTRKVAKL